MFMIPAIVRTAMTSLRRDRAALALSFVLPIVFFTIFALVFGGRRSTTPRVMVLLADEDRSPVSTRLVDALQQEGSLLIKLRPAAVKGVEQPEYTAATAELAVKSGEAPIALIIPHGFGAAPLSFGASNANRPSIQMLEDTSDPVASQMVSGLLQKVAVTSAPDLMAEEGTKYIDQIAGGLSREQHARINESLDQLRQFMSSRRTAVGAGTRDDRDFTSGTLIAVTSRPVVGEKKDQPMISFYAAAISVMFLLFTASGAAGAMLDEVESGTLERVLSSRVTMSAFMGGKLIFNVLLAFTQLVVMFLWGWAVFKLDFWSHIPGFIVMGLSTAFAVAAFGILLASICRTRAQLGALSTLTILVMSSIGGSMFPRFLMPEGMQKAGLFTINAWAIDGFIKVFWRDEPVSHLWPQVAVLTGLCAVLFAIARRVARKWEFS